MNTRQALLLIIIAVATGWFLQTPKTEQSTSAASKQGPDMYAANIEVTVMDESGQPVYLITADHLVHSPYTNRFDLTQPYIELKRPTGDNWKIRSERGQMTDKADELWFLGEVNIHRTGTKPMHIQTSDLQVKPDEELAETEKGVSISTAQYRIDALGLKADFRSGLLEFKSRVRGTINAAG